MKDGYVSSSIVLLDMNQEVDVIENDRNLRKSGSHEPSEHKTCTFLLDMGFSLCKIETENLGDVTEDTLYHVMPLDFFS